MNTWSAVQKRLPAVWALVVAGFGVYALIVMWSAATAFSSQQVATQGPESAEADQLEAAVTDVREQVTELAGSVDEAMPENPEDVAAIAADVDAVQDEVGEALTETKDLTAPTAPSLKIFGFDWKPSSEELFLWLVVVAGALGGGIHILAQSGNITGSWYLPVFGAAVALVTYFAIRGGLLNVNLDGSSLNPYTIVGMSAGVGLYSKRILEKLKEKLPV